MEPFHAVVLTVSLFVLTFFNPGANLFVVVQTSLASGRRAGVITGLGVATGDAFYSGLGLFPGWGFSVWRRSLRNAKRYFLLSKLSAAPIYYGSPGTVFATRRRRK